MLEALAEELPKETIRFSSKVAAIETQTQTQEDSSVAIIHLADGTSIRTKVINYHFFFFYLFILFIYLVFGLVDFDRM